MLGVQLMVMPGKNTDIFVCLLRPLDETIALLVPLVFKRHILTQGIGAAVKSTLTE